MAIKTHDTHKKQKQEQKKITVTFPRDTRSLLGFQRGNLAEINQDTTIALATREQLRPPGAKYFRRGLSTLDRPDGNFPTIYLDWRDQKFQETALSALDSLDGNFPTIYLDWRQTTRFLCGTIALIPLTAVRFARTDRLPAFLHPGGGGEGGSPPLQCEGAVRHARSMIDTRAAPRSRYCKRSITPQLVVVSSVPTTSLSGVKTLTRCTDYRSPFHDSCIPGKICTV